jgi:hypothetical protein
VRCTDVLLDAATAARLFSRKRRHSIWPASAAGGRLDVLRYKRGRMGPSLKLGIPKSPIMRTPSRNYIGTGIQPPPLNQYRTAETLNHPRQWSARPNGKSALGTTCFPLNSVLSPLERAVPPTSSSGISAGRCSGDNRLQVGLLGEYEGRTRRQSKDIARVYSRSRLWQQRNTGCNSCLRCLLAH